MPTDPARDAWRSSAGSAARQEQAAAALSTILKRAAERRLPALQWQIPPLGTWLYGEVPTPAGLCPHATAEAMYDVLDGYNRLLIDVYTETKTVLGADTLRQRRAAGMTMPSCKVSHDDSGNVLIIAEDPTIVGTHLGDVRLLDVRVRCRPPILPPDGGDCGCDDDRMSDPCQPIGCDNGYHLPGCPYDGADGPDDEPTPKEADRG